MRSIDKQYTHMTRLDGDAKKGLEQMKNKHLYLVICFTILFVGCCANESNLSINPHELCEFLSFCKFFLLFYAKDM